VHTKSISFSNLTRETAEKESELESYERKMNRIIEAKNRDEVNIHLL